MHKNLVRLGTFGNISSNGSFQTTIPLKGAITNIQLISLNSSGAPVAVGSELDSISLVAGDQGEIVKPMTPADLLTNALYKFASRGYAAITGVTPLYMAPANPSEAERLAYMIGTNGLSSLTVEIETGTLLGVAQVEVWGERLIGGQFDGMGLGRHVRLSKETVTSTGTGEKSFDNFPYVGGNGVRLMAIYAKNAAGTGTITKAKVEVNELPEHFAHMACHEHAQRLAGRTPQANVFAVDFALENNALAGRTLGGVSRLNFTAFWSVDPAAAHDVIVETLHGVNEAKGV